MIARVLVRIAVVLLALCAVSAVEGCSAESSDDGLSEQTEAAVVEPFGEVDTDADADASGDVDDTSSDSAAGKDADAESKDAFVEGSSGDALPGLIGKWQQTGFELSRDGTRVEAEFQWQHIMEFLDDGTHITTNGTAVSWAPYDDTRLMLSSSQLGEFLYFYQLNGDTLYFGASGENQQVLEYKRVE